MSRYLVTGGCGFIGAHLVRALLAAGHETVVLDDLSTGRREALPPGVRLIEASILDGAALRRALAGAEGCFHLAAIASVPRSIEDWAGTHRVNLGGTVEVFAAAVRAAGGPLPVVYASSAAVYGDAGEAAVAEEAPIRPSSPYGADKYGCELQARAGGRAQGLPSFGLRLFNIYGPGQDPRSPYSGVISTFLARARRGLPLELHGGGGQRRDFVFVEDAVRCFAAAMAKASPEGPVANVATGRGTAIRALAAAVLGVTGSASPLLPAPPRPGDIACSIGDPARAGALLGWRAEVALAEGLDRTAALVSR